MEGGEIYPDVPRQESAFRNTVKRCDSFSVFVSWKRPVNMLAYMVTDLPALGTLGCVPPLELSSIGVWVHQQDMSLLPVGVLFGRFSAKKKFHYQCG